MKVPFTDHEFNVICARLCIYNPATNPYFLRFVWDDKMSTKKGAVCTFRPPDLMIFPLVLKSEILDSPIFDAKICKELYRCLQYREQGSIKYHLYNLLALNERSAKAEEARVAEL
jgi:hypothetical protein